MSEAKQINLGPLSDLEEGDKRSFDAEGTQVLVCRVRGELYAIEDLCSHANKPLCRGRLSGYMITCPVHSARFDIRDGAHQGPPAFTGIRTFPIEEGADGAIVTVTPKPLPAGFGGPLMTR
ncbi:MAG TPA: Rieske 2Fe-2S domain-containing protein [Pseudomonadales bacterium]|jgi:3-phenylpropionate/trans-cinnamate dioxygenase ferredoxin subunit